MTYFVEHEGIIFNAYCNFAKRMRKNAQQLQAHSSLELTIIQKQVLGGITD